MPNVYGTLQAGTDDWTYGSMGAQDDIGGALYISHNDAAGWRFALDAEIPAGATITSAVLSFADGGRYTSGRIYDIYGLADLNPPFGTVTPLTSKHIYMSTGDGAGFPVPENLAEIVQEIVNAHGGIPAGTYLGLYIRSDTVGMTEWIKAGAGQATLTITYEEGSPGIVGVLAAPGVPSESALEGGTEITAELDAPGVPSEMSLVAETRVTGVLNGPGVPSETELTGDAIGEITGVLVVPGAPAESSLLATSAISGEIHSPGVPTDNRLTVYVPGIDPRGRQPIGVNQPPGGGTDYPLVQPSSDVEYLLGDFYLSYEDPKCRFVPPFSIAWMHGFGENVVPAPPGYPNHTHAHDLIVVDAEGRTVFDSTLAGSYHEQLWGNGRLLIIEWKTVDEVCRCTKHLAWTHQDMVQGQTKSYDKYIIPEQAILDPRTLNRLPLRVRSLVVGALTMTANTVEMTSGYNMSIRLDAEDPDAVDTTDLDLDFVPETKTVIPGTRITHPVRFVSGAGLGMGRVPGCDEEEPPIKRINSVRPDASGNIILDLAECLRLQRPVTVLDHFPRLLRYAAQGLSAEQAMAALEIHNDCGPCCDCDFYVRVYKGLKRQWNLGQDLAGRIETVRDTLERNIDRWEAARRCREAHTARVVVIPEPDCKVAMGGNYCNNHQCCVTPLVMRFTVQVFRDGVETDGLGSDCHDLTMSGASTSIEGEKRAMSGTWPVFEVTFDYANPLDGSSAGFRVCVPLCTKSDDIRVTLTIHYPDMEPSADGKPCNNPVIPTPAALAAIWSASELGMPQWPIRAMVESPLVPLNNNNAYCERCDCPRGENVEQISEHL